MKNKIIKSLSSLNIKFILMNVISALIILVGIGAILYYIYEGTVSGHVNNFNKAFVDINRFVNRNDESCEEYLNNVAKLYDVNAVIADVNGDILLKSKNVEGDKLDVEKSGSGLIENTKMGMYIKFMISQ